MLGDFGVLVDDVVLIPAILGLAVKLGLRGSSGSISIGQDQVPEMRPDREFGDIHTHARVVANLGLLATDQREQIMAVDRSPSDRLSPRAERIVGSRSTVCTIA